MTHTHRIEKAIEALATLPLSTLRQMKNRVDKNGPEPLAPILGQAIYRHDPDRCMAQFDFDEAMATLNEALTN